MNTDLQRLIGKILSDEAFTQALAENPEKALQEANINPTVDLLEALDGVDIDTLKNLAATFGDDQAAV